MRAASRYTLAARFALLPRTCRPAIPGRHAHGLLLSAPSLGGRCWHRRGSARRRATFRHPRRKRQGGPGQPTFSLAVDYVEVDAGVYDGEGHPVRDLRKEDFEVSSKMGTASRWTPSRSWTCPPERTRRRKQRPLVRRDVQTNVAPVRRANLHPPARRSSHRRRPDTVRAGGGPLVRGTDAAAGRPRSRGTRLRASGREPGLYERSPPAARVHRPLHRPEGTLGRAERNQSPTARRRLGAPR